MKSLFTLFALAAAFSQAAFADQSCRPSMAVALEKAKADPMCFSNCIKTLDAIVLVMNEQSLLRGEQIMAAARARLKHGILSWTDNDFSPNDAYRFLVDLGFFSNNVVKVADARPCNPKLTDVVAKLRNAPTCSVSCVTTIDAVVSALDRSPGFPPEQILNDAKNAYKFSLSDAINLLAELGLLENNYTRSTN